jgi:hypothetical protein
VGFMVAIHFVGLAVEVLDVAWILRLNVSVMAVVLNVMLLDIWMLVDLWPCRFYLKRFVCSLAHCYLLCKLP